MSEKEKREKINKALDAFAGGGSPTDSETQKREKIEQALGAFAGGGTPTDSETQKREKIEQALGAFAGGGGGAGLGATSSETQSKTFWNSKSFAINANSDPMGGGTTVERDRKMKKRRSRELNKTEKGFLETHLPVTGGTLTRNTKKSKRRGSLNIFIEGNPSLAPPSANHAPGNTSPIPQSPSPRNTSHKYNKKRRASLFPDLVGIGGGSEEVKEEVEEQPAPDVDGKTHLLQIKNFSSLTSPQIIDLLEEVKKSPQVDEASMLGLVRQMSCLFATARCSLRGRICETFTKLQPSQLALQTLLILTLNIADEELQRKAANFLTSVMTSHFSASSFPSSTPPSPSSRPSRLQDLFKGCEFLVWSGANEAGGSEFVKNCVSSIQGVVDMNEPARLHLTALTEETLKKELEKKEKEGNFVVLGWLLCCLSENSKMISETSLVSDTIIEILKRENGVMKAFALVVLYHLYNVTRYKTSTSLLREIFSDPNQEQTIVELATALKSAQKRKK